MTTRVAARRAAELRSPGPAAMPKRGCTFADAAPLQLKVRVGQRELSRGVCAERYSREIFGECRVGFPHAGAWEVVSAGRAPRELRGCGTSSPAGLRER